MPTNTCASGTARLATAAVSALAFAVLLPVHPAAAQSSSPHEDLGYLTTRVYAMASTCGFVVDDVAYLDWMRATVPPDAQAAFGAGSSRAGDEIAQALGAEGLAVLDPQGSGLRSPTPEWAALVSACPDLRAAAEGLGLLAQP
jgi:hypothetical protein